MAARPAQRRELLPHAAKRASALARQAAERGEGEMVEHLGHVVLETRDPLVEPVAVADGGGHGVAIDEVECFHFEAGTAGGKISR